MRTALWILSVAALAGCLVAPILAFTGRLDDAGYKTALLVCSLLWFTISSVRIYLPAKR